MKRVAIAVVLLLCVARQPSGQTRVPRFEADPAFPTIPNNWVLGDVSSVAVDAASQ